MQVFARPRQYVHLARADPDTRGDRNVPLFRAQCCLHVDRSANSAQRVVLVQLRYAEDGHHRIADELLDRSPVPGDRFAHQLEVARDQLPIDLRIEIRRETRRIDEIAEEDGDRSAIRSSVHSHRAGCSQRSVLPENRLLQRAQFLAGLEPELVHQHAARVLVCLERVGLPSRAVERQHQLRPEAFPQGLLIDELLQLADQLACGAQLEVGVDPLFERR